MTGSGFVRFHRLLSWDVASTIFSREESRRQAVGLRASVLARTVPLYPLSLLPLVGLLLQVAFVLVVLAHALPARERRRATAAAGGTLWIARGVPQ